MRNAMKNTFRIIAAASALAVASVSSAATLTLVPQYVGSTTSTVTPPTAAYHPAAPAGLTPLDFTQAASHSSTFRHWFRLDMNFTGANAGEDFKDINFDVKITTAAAGANLVTRGGVAPPTGTGAGAFFNFNNAFNATAGAASLDTTADSSNDALFVQMGQNNDPSIAATTQLGEAGAGGAYTLGWFYVQTKDNNAVTVSAAEANGANFAFWTGNDTAAGTFVTQATGVTTGTATLAAAGTVPEPTSLAFLAVGGLMAARRRRA